MDKSHEHLYKSKANTIISLFNNNYLHIPPLLFAAPSQPNTKFISCPVILIGDVSVGKTCLLSRYLKNQLPKTVGPTIGVEFATKNVSMKDGATVKAQLWDTAGQEKYRAITVAHYRKALGCLIVFDVTNRKTFNNVKYWL